MAKAPVILVSDDEANIITSLGRLALRYGLEVVGDTTSRDVLALAKKLRPNVIVMDIHQPIDGRDLLAQLKKDAETKDIPVVVLSAWEDQFVRHACFDLGAVDFVVKPFDSVFMRRLARLCGVDPDATDGQRSALIASA